MTDPRTWLARTLPAPPAMAQMIARAHHGGRLDLEALGRLRAAADPRGLEPRACGGGPALVPSRDRSRARRSAAGFLSPLGPRLPAETARLRARPEPIGSRHEAWRKRGARGDGMWTRTTQDWLDNSRRDSDPPLGREAASEGDGHLAAGGRLRQTSGNPRIRRRDGQDASRTSDQHGPNLGTSWRRRARRRRRPVNRSDGERTGPERRRGPRRSARRKARAEYPR